MNILIVDDREYDALDLSSRITAICPVAEVKWRSSPNRALGEATYCDTEPYDVVFVDQHMPEGLGTDLVKRFNKALNRKVTRVVMLTSDGGDTTRTEALVSDCDGFLTKPADINRLRAILDGSKCYWEPSDLPSDLDQYRKLMSARHTRIAVTAG